MKILSCLTGLIDTSQRQKLFHKNLFLDESAYHDLSDNEAEFDNEEEFECDTKPSIYSKEFENEANVYKLKHLPVPLTETIAEVLQEFTHDKFIFDDISFVIEMSRKRALSPYAIIVALIYLNRLKKKKANSSGFSKSFFSTSESGFDKYSANYLTNTELCLISLLLASKYLIDEGETEEIYNDEWADVSDLPVQEINKLEKSFLRQMEWELYVSSKEFWMFTNELTERTTRKKIQHQYNQCTYTDLEFLLSSSSNFSPEIAKKFFEQLTKVFIVFSTTMVYIVASSFAVTVCLFYIKTQIDNVSQQQSQVTNENNENRTQVCIEMDRNLYSRQVETSNSLTYLQNDLESIKRTNSNRPITYKLNEMNECHNMKVMNLVEAVKVLKMNKKVAFNQRKRHHRIGNLNFMNQLILK